MALFIEGAADAKVADRLPYLREGSYQELEVVGLKGFLTRKKEKMVAAEYRVIKSQGPQANAPGTMASHLINLSKDGAIGNLMNLAAALTNKSVKQVNDAELNALVTSPDNPKPSPAIGHKVAAEAFLIDKKDGTGQWLKVQYAYVPAETTTTAAPTAGETTSTGRVTKK